jgi:uncharacterized protein YndB with AHSA1/START domain
MNDNSLTIDFTVDRPTHEAFAAITDVRGWWAGEIDGPTDVLGAEFTYRYQDIHRSTQRITELVPGKRVVWSVVDSRLSFVEDPAEWTGTEITFDLEPVDGGTRVRFTHVGLTPEGECYDQCSGAWDHYIAAGLRHYIGRDAS